jgi:hypothetical protein
VVGVAGGTRKIEAILAALRGKWINVLITDKRTAESLLSLVATPSKEDRTIRKTSKKSRT